MFSQTSEYALRAIVNLASHPSRPMTTEQLAGLTKVPAGYLSKVMLQLSRAELVVSQRGLHGGYTLSKRPEEIVVLDVINAVDPIKHIDTCPLGLEKHGTRLCPLHRRLEGAIQQIEANFAACSIAELLEPSESKQTCSKLFQNPSTNT